MIIFFGSFEIIVILLLIVACIAWGVETVGKLLPIIFAVALIKNLVQDIVFAIFKNRKNVFLSLLYLIIDFVRMALFFYTANFCVTRYAMGGAAYLDGIFGLLVYLLVGGLLFIVGELCSVQHGMKESVKTSEVILVDFCILVLLFLIYLFWIH